MVPDPSFLTPFPRPHFVIWKYSASPETPGARKPWRVCPGTCCPWLSAWASHSSSVTWYGGLCANADHAARAHRPRFPLGDRAGGAAAAGQRLPAHPRPEVLLGAAALDHGRGADGRRAVSHRACHFLPAPALHADLAATPARIRAGKEGGQVHAAAEAHARGARIRGAGGHGDRRHHARQGGHAVLEARSLSTGRINLGRRVRAAWRVGA